MNHTSTGNVREEQHAWGAQIIDQRGVRFRVWAPDHRELLLAIEGERNLLQMNALGHGWYQLTTDRAKAASRYRYVLPDGRRLPDPASRFQPADVHGPSEVISSTDYRWRDENWTGRPWKRRGGL